MNTAVSSPAVGRLLPRPSTFKTTLPKSGGPSTCWRSPAA